MFTLQTYLMYRAESRDPFKMALEQKRATLRRMEQEAVERHDEFVYYDAAREHSRCYQICCCPNYGKITSRRIIYSEPNPITADSCICCPTSVLNAVTGCWCKKIETMDYRLIDDVSVEQSCLDFATGAGTIVVHCHGSTDQSIRAGERERLVLALQERNITLLKQAVRVCKQLDDLTGLNEEYHAALKMIAEIEEEQQAEAKAAGKIWTPTYVLDTEENSALTIRVVSVTSPFAVMDDLSYKISTATNDRDYGERDD